MANTFAPLWSSIVDSSLWLEDDWVIKIFLTMVAKKDYDHVYRGHTFNLAQQSKKTEQQVLEALTILSAPDQHRVEDTLNAGRRILAHEEGWLIINGEKYQKLMQREAKRARDRKAQAIWRDKQKNRLPHNPSERRFEEHLKNGDQAGMDRETNTSADT